jgi:GTP-binding protein
MDLLDEVAVTFQIVLTKADALSAKALDETLQKVAATIAAHPAAHPQAIATSALDKRGIDLLQEQLAPFAAPMIASRP